MLITISCVIFHLHKTPLTDIVAVFQNPASWDPQVLTEDFANAKVIYLTLYFSLQLGL